MGATYQESRYFMPTKLALFLEDGLQAKSSFTSSGSKLSRNNSNRGQWVSHHRFSLICVKHTNRLRKGSNKNTRYDLKKKKRIFLMTLSLAVINLPQLHTPRHQEHAALDCSAHCHSRKLSTMPPLVLWHGRESASAFSLWHPTLPLQHAIQKTYFGEMLHVFWHQEICL